MIKTFENFNNNEISREEKIEFILNNVEGTSADYDEINILNDEQLDKFYNNLKVEYVKESDGSSVASVGSGTAVGGGAQGSFTSSMGVSYGGGDSGSAFATNSNVSGMGPIVSAQPSDIPGDVRGGTKGSGDIGQVLGTYGKQPAGRNKKKKKNSKSKVASDIDKLYTTKYTEKYSNGKIITNWNTFNNK